MIRTSIEIGGIVPDIWNIPFDNAALSYLAENPAKGISRYQAFMRLLESSLHSTTTHKPTFGDEITVEPFQTVIVISELASGWKWSRESVRKFLNGLLDLGLISRKPLDRCTLITMNVVQTTENGKPNHKVVALHPQLAELYVKWESGKISDSEISAGFKDVLDKVDIDRPEYGCRNTPLVSETLGALLQLRIEKNIGESILLAQPEYQYLTMCASCIFDGIARKNWKYWWSMQKNVDLCIQKILQFNPGIAFSQLENRLIETLFNAFEAFMRLDNRNPEAFVRDFETFIDDRDICPGETPEEPSTGRKGHL